LKSRRRYSPQHPAGSPQQRRHWMLQSLCENDSLAPTPIGELPMQKPVLPVPKIRGFGAAAVAETISLDSCCGRKRDSAVKPTADADNGRTAASVEPKESSVGGGVTFLIPSATSPMKDSSFFLLGNSLKPVGNEFSWQASHSREDSPSRSMPSDTLAEETFDDRSPTPSLTPARPSIAARAVATPGGSPRTVHTPVPLGGRLPLFRLPEWSTFGAECTWHTARDGVGAPEGALLTSRGDGGFYTARTEGVFPSARGGVTEAGTGGVTSPGERVLAAGTGCTASPLQRVCSPNVEGAASPDPENAGFLTARSRAATPRTPCTWRETQTFSTVRTWVRKESPEVCGSELDTYLGDELDCIAPLPLSTRSKGGSSARSTAASANSVPKECCL
jgi:hypothetical protein